MTIMPLWIVTVKKRCAARRPPFDCVYVSRGFPHATLLAALDHSLFRRFAERRHFLGSPWQQAQQIDGRTLIVARQQIRSELAAAASKGELTRLDQYRILMHAKETLPPEDVEGLMRTMDRLAVKNQPSAASPVAQVAETRGRGDSQRPGRDAC